MDGFRWARVNTGKVSKRWPLQLDKIFVKQYQVKTSKKRRKKDYNFFQQVAEYVLVCATMKSPPSPRPP